MTQKKNMVKLAKKTTTKKKTAVKSTPKPKKKTTTKNNDILELDETKTKKGLSDRDLKAKQRVEELLRDVKLTKTDDKEIVVRDNKGDEKSLEWFEEQTTLLSDEVEKLRSELSNAKQLIKKYEEGGNTSTQDLKPIVIKLFNELQENYIRSGFDSYGRSNFVIYPKAFINRVAKFFPFLEKIKKI